MELKPRGQRPKCLYCGKELRPNFRDDEPLPQGSYRWTAQQRTAWDRQHKHFDGTYGRYNDSLFCGLNCGYRWAKKNARRYMNDVSL